MISSSSSEMSRIAVPCSRSCSSTCCTASIAPTSRPRVGCTATISLGPADISRARIAFCRLPPESRRACTSTVGAAMS